MPCLYMSCCSGWNAVTPVLVLLFTVVRDGRRQSTQLFSGQVSLWIDMTCDQNQTSNSLSVYRLMNMSTHREARIRHKTVTINFIASCQFLCCRSQTFSYQQLQQLIFQVFLQYCNQTFQIQQHISHPVCVAGAFHVYHLCFLATIASGQPLLLLPRNCFRLSSTSTILWDSHCWCGAMAVVSQQDVKTQDLEASRQNSCDHDSSQK